MIKCVNKMKRGTRGIEWNINCTYILGKFIFDDSLLFWHATSLGSRRDAQCTCFRDTIGANSVIWRPHVFWEHSKLVQLGDPKLE